jgi:polysaccharide export outer membrane protein
LRNYCHVAWISGLIGLMIQLIPTPVLADYLVHRGDVLDIDVPGAPALSRRAAVDENGKIYLPLIQGLSAVGLSASDLQLKLRDLLVTRGIRNPEVTVKILEYRPVYIEGAVTYPGSYPYRRGLVVRDAVAVADGYDIRQRPETARLFGELVNQALRVARLQAALDGQTEIDVKHLSSVPIAPANLSEITTVQAQQLKAEQGDHEQEKAHVRRMIETTREELAYLEQARQQETREIGQLRDEAARARQLMQNGVAQWTRVLEQQQALSAAEFRLFDVMARATAARKGLESLDRQLQKVDDNRKIKILQELETALMGLATIQLRLQAEPGMGDGLAVPEVSSGGVATRQFSILREAEDGNQQPIAADEGTSLLPGDRVQVTATTKATLSAVPAPAGASTVAGARPRP